MATTTTGFEAEIPIAAPGEPGQRALMAGATYRLREYYLRGGTDPAAHVYAKQLRHQKAALIRAGKEASFDAITAV